MPARLERSKDIERFILQNLPGHPRDIVRVTAEAFGVTRQAVHRTLARLIREERVRAAGQTRSRQYALGPTSEHAVELKVTPGLDEHRVWMEDIRPHLEDVPKNVLSICEYGFTEMLNNVIDHSESSMVVASVGRDVHSIRMDVLDRGVGIFNKIQRAHGLPSVNDAILELTKGKLTTDPSHHTGEGVFFSSKMFDEFTILSSDVFLHCRAERESWALEARDSPPGTLVGMEIRRDSTRTTQEVFERFASAGGDFSFDRTTLVVKLAEPEGSTLVSRSQAKRILTRLENFREVMLDFTGVETIGPAFADEVFRVYAQSHPTVQMIPIHENAQVRQMIQRAMRAREQDGAERRDG